MERYGTFNVDHTKLDRGIYLSREDKIGDRRIITVDIRMCSPYVDKGLSDVVMHSIEHIMATNLESERRLNKIYFGIMGCRTGCYYVFSTDKDDTELPMILGKVLKYAVDKWDRCTVPFNTREECGNCTTLATVDYGIEDVRNMMDLIRELADYLVINNEFNKYNYL